MENKKIVQRILAGGVVVRGSKALIVMRSKNDDVFPGLWEIPSGKKEPFEKLSDTIIREIKEEVGLKIKIVRICNTFNFTVEKQDETRDATQINFVVEIVGSDKVKLSSEHDDYAWVGVTDLDKYNISSETKEAIKLTLGK